jgi:CRP-like cAMP-binding protein
LTRLAAVSKQIARRNRILAALPDEEFARLLPHFESVHLEKGEIVYLTGDDIQYAYFLDSGLLSFLSTTETGSTIEVAMVGNEGLVGLPVILRSRIIPYQVMVQFASEAFKLRAEALQEEFDRGETLNEWVLRYINVLMTQIAQSCICNRFHSFEKTLSRWLLTVQDRVNLDSLNLTHETISHALGVPRTAVTMAAGALQSAGVIRYSRGKIFILDHPGLEAHSCECYRIIGNELRHFLKE